MSIDLTVVLGIDWLEELRKGVFALVLYEGMVVSLALGVNITLTRYSIWRLSRMRSSRVKFCDD